MDSPDKDWWVVHTGEYVLGLLDEQDTLVLERVMQHEPDIEKMVADWSNWFQPISDSLAPIEPPAHLLPAMLTNLPQRVRRSSAAQSTAQVAADAAANANHSGQLSIGQDGVHEGASVMHLLRKNQQQTDRWRAFAGMAVVACLLLTLRFGLLV